MQNVGEGEEKYACSFEMSINTQLLENKINTTLFQ
jgi:hypothetical protein